MLSDVFGPELSFSRWSGSRGSLWLCSIVCAEIEVELSFCDVACGRRQILLGDGSVGRANIEAGGHSAPEPAKHRKYTERKGRD